MTTPQEPHVRPFAEFLREHGRGRTHDELGEARLGYKLTRPGDVLRDAFGEVLDVIREADFDPWLMP